MKILICISNKTISNIVRIGLQSYGYIIEVNYIQNSIYPTNVDLIICDTETALSKNIVDKIKNVKKDIPIIGIVTKGGWEQKTEFLNKGGDDVLTYPFPFQELLARIQSLLRRPSNYKSRIIKIKNINIDTTERKVFVKRKEIRLRKKEYHILEYLARNLNRPISRTELLDHVWDYKCVNGSNTVDVHINRIRAYPTFKEKIRTIYGFGYQLCDETTTSSASQDEYSCSDL